MTDKTTVVVNATALRTGGGLTILRQFVSKIDPENVNYIVFIDHTVQLNRPHDNIRFVKLSKTSMLSRIMWDAKGLNNWLYTHGVIPSLFISLQNTSVRLSTRCPKLIYLHQPLPFSNKNWSIFKKEEYRFFLYKKFYLYFIFRYVDFDTQFVVQTEWIKQALVTKHKIEPGRIEVFKPDQCFVEAEKTIAIDVAQGEKIIFYPATPIIYKNHVEIINAMCFLKDKGVDLTGVSVCFTFLEKDSPRLSGLVNRNGLENNFKFLGSLSYAQVLSYYKASTLVVFPSYIETFGLPLAEAMAFKKPILVANEEYSREVLKGYQWVEFLNINQPDVWGSAVERLVNSSDVVADGMSTTSDKDGIKTSFGKQRGWTGFFELIKKLL